MAIEKLATLYAITQNFRMSGLTKPHVMQLLKMIDETSTGAALLSLNNKLGINNATPGTASWLYTSPKGKFCIMFVVKDVEALRPYVDTIEVFSQLMEQQGVTVEIETIDTFAKSLH